jgi:hypothetical protein
MAEVIYIYHNIYENDGQWCVDYTTISTGVRETRCFETNNEAADFYMS